MHWLPMLSAVRPSGSWRSVTRSSKKLYEEELNEEDLHEDVPCYDWCRARKYYLMALMCAGDEDRAAIRDQ